MPTVSEILAGMTSIANEQWLFAVIWHLVIAAVAVAWLRGWHPSRRAVAMSVALPLASASAFAWAYGNPFNGSVLAALALALALLGARAGREPAEAAGGWRTAGGLLMVAYAVVYPHFLAAGTALAYLVAAPVGLVPCPTLSLAIGVALATRALPRQASIVLAAAGLFYGIVGIVRLGVVLDVGLLAGALALALAALPARRILRHA